MIAAMANHPRRGQPKASGLTLALSVILCGLWAASAVAAHGQSTRLDATGRASVIERVLAVLREFYVSEAVAKKMEADVRARQDAGDYDVLTGAEQFAHMLTRDLQAVSGDKHLVVEFSADPITANVPSRPPLASMHSPEEAEPPRLPNGTERDTCRFVNVATLTGNIGYIKFDAFLPPDRCAETAAAAMSLVADCDALLLDLRDNSGGDAFMVAFMSSYFFSQPVHLSDLYERRTNVTVESWTLPFVPGRRFLDKPIFILTSPRTFSAAEEFAFNLQTLKRAVVVGDTSGGGAHPTLTLRLNAHFHIAVPVARYINPISRTNWEAVGVAPDLRARENTTVQTAYRAALEEVMGRTTSAEQRETLRRQVEALTRAINAQH
jgi:hypothetical protein